MSHRQKLTGSDVGIWNKNEIEIQILKMWTFLKRHNNSLEGVDQTNVGQFLRMTSASGRHAGLLYRPWIVLCRFSGQQ